MAGLGPSPVAACASMEAWIEAVLARAEARVAGLDFNAESYARRAEMEAREGQAVSYEVTLEGSPDQHTFVAQTLDRLQIHLQGKKFDPTRSRGLLVWVWRDGEAHLFTGPRFREALESLDPTAPQLLLPPSRL